MYCSNCGSKIPNGALECPECKEKVVNENESPMEEAKVEETPEVKEEIVKKEELSTEKVVEKSEVVENVVSEETNEMVAETEITTEEVKSNEKESNIDSTISLHDKGDTGGPGSALLGFFLPPVGFVMYFLNKKKKPNNSKANLKGAIFGTVIFSVAYCVFTYVVKPLLMPVVNQKNCEVRCNSDKNAIYEKSSGYCRCPDGRVFQVEYK